MEYIETERLILRDYKASDLIIFQEMNLDKDVRKFFPNVLSYKRSKLALEAMQHEIEMTGLGLYAVEVKETRDFIGFVGTQYLETHPMFHLDIMPCYEIGWRLKKSAWGHGYATEAAKAVIKFVQPQVALPIYSFTSSINIPSRNVMEKIGMTFVKYFSHPLIAETSELSEHVLYEVPA